ncbi:hypothetical protein F0P96_19395 [Hymenobacter busanensis]|uniref:Uncharacterized protein n=1 Tax=Hymenobacter busanensis TaxID=2607656 RepID=A0A7L4ZSZ3_9BACT|nr:hypothetical protein [Hymenobacter busanensis]KAA9325930.1 hypothetical protein F0P96_19395 [Hymenobacter busanensis]QHJ06231.1 hypothetical protein GUY19_02530 [Hymenobacter busanensis]
MPEKLQTLLLILFGLVVFVVRLVRKARETMRREAQERRLPGPDQRTSAPRPVRPPGAPSFEELLQQMKQQNQRGQSAAPAETTPAGRAVPRETAPAPRTLEVPDRAARSLEEPATRRVARSQETPVVAEARRASSLPRVSKAHPHEDYWSRQAAERPAVTTAAEVAARLRNPADVRAAFVLAEVLQRRDY